MPWPFKFQFSIVTPRFQKPLGRPTIGAASWSFTTDRHRQAADERELQSPHEAPQPDAPRSRDSTSPQTGAFRRIRATRCGDLNASADPTSLSACVARPGQ